MRKGNVTDVEIIPPKKVQAELQTKIDEAQARFDANPTDRNLRRLDDAKKDLENATRDNECLIRGCIPNDYIQGGN